MNSAEFKAQMEQMFDCQMGPPTTGFVWRDGKAVEGYDREFWTHTYQTFLLKGSVPEKVLWIAMLSKFEGLPRMPLVWRVPPQTWQGDRGDRGVTYVRFRMSFPTARAVKALLVNGIPFVFETLFLFDEMSAEGEDDESQELR
jgi:hypothetical protein